ncbi:MAG: DNA cytosine methyltransferase [Patescibacteria group bacterium]|nr:DNA cytosine methyltransferase [Patescibacteria group bacterium]
MKILVACERSGKVRRAFNTLGHLCFSCDLVPADDGETRFHLQGDVREYFKYPWDMMIAFPPCTHLCVSGAKHFKTKRALGLQQQAIAFFMDVVKAPIRRIAVENPVGIMSTIFRQPDQIIQPWQFGHGETKATCLWLKNLPLLETRVISEGRVDRIHKMAPSENRGVLRSITYDGVADAMSLQWGSL